LENFIEICLETSYFVKIRQKHRDCTCSALRTLYIVNGDVYSLAVQTELIVACPWQQWLCV